MISFEQYAKIHNNYGICYFGYADEYLLLLKLVRPHLESAFPGLNIYLGCRDEAAHYLADTDRILKVSEIKIRRPEFAHIRELQFDMGHPIENLLNEAGISPVPLFLPRSENITGYCSIVTRGSHPTKNLNNDQIEAACKYARKYEFEPLLDADPNQCGMVIGVESVSLIKSLQNGIRTVLIPTGVGESLYKKMFPDLEILQHLSHR